jgi:hypothetical protein
MATSSFPECVAAVVDDDDLLTLIFSRLDSVKTLAWTSAVSKRCYATVSLPSVLKEIRARSSPPLLGFITVYVRMDWTYVRFVPLPGLCEPLEIEAAA